MVEIRKYKTSDCKQIAELFFETVHAVNAKDYTKAQLDAWASGDIDFAVWNESFLQNHTLVAVEKGEIVGFGDMRADGYLDRLYVHKDHQGKGIATAILHEIEQHALLLGVSHFATHASITAVEFFKKRGYQIIRENTVVRNGETLKNFFAEKQNK